jgi:phosphoribosylformimino-5-aminoimidazole carboxamide ribotide isomerase
MTAIIPAIDIIEGHCVRLEQGSFAKKKTYRDDPLEVAQEFESAGLNRLHLVDLDGARGGCIKNYRVLERIATQTSLRIDFGGGIKSDEDIRIAFESGASQVTGGSIAVKNRELFLSWIKRYTAEKIILGADALEKKIAVSGWEESTTLDIFQFLEEYQQKGIIYAVITDIAKDGLLQGPSFDLYAEIQDRVPQVKIIASGGVSTLSDVEKLVEMRVEGIIIGKALYEGRILLTDLSQLQEDIEKAF